MAQCIVVFDDQAGACWPFGWDDDCEGAIRANGESVAVFPDSKAAKTAIRISTLFAKLREAQGRPPNTDFTDSLRHVKVVPLVGPKGGD